MSQFHSNHCVSAFAYCEIIVSSFFDTSHQTETQVNVFFIIILRANGTHTYLTISLSPVFCCSDTDY